MELDKGRFIYRSTRKLKSSQKSIIRDLGLEEFFVKDKKGKGKSKLELPLDLVYDKYELFLLPSYDAYKWLFIPLSLTSLLVVDYDFYWLFKEGVIDGGVLELYKDLDIDKLVVLDLQLDDKISKDILDRYKALRTTLLKHKYEYDDDYLRYELIQMLVPYRVSMDIFYGDIYRKPVEVFKKLATHLF